MQAYEIILIVSPDADQDAVEESINIVANFTKKHNGEILKSKNKGLKHLSYPIKSYNDGHHIVLIALLPPKEVITLDSELRSNEIIIRHFITKTHHTQDSDESSEVVENTETVENTEAVENSEAVENTETVENSEAVENTETVENSETDDTKKA